MDCRELFSNFICRTYLNGTTLKWFYLWFTDWCYSYVVDITRLTWAGAMKHFRLHCLITCMIWPWKASSGFFTVPSQSLEAVLPLRRDFQAWVFVVRCSSSLPDLRPMTIIESQRFSNFSGNSTYLLLTLVLRVRPWEKKNKKPTYSSHKPSGIFKADIRQYAVTHCLLISFFALCDLQMLVLRHCLHLISSDFGTHHSTYFGNVCEVEILPSLQCFPASSFHFGKLFGKSFYQEMGL